LKLLRQLFEDALTAEINKKGDIEFPFAQSVLTPVDALQSDKVAYDDEFRAWTNEVWLYEHRQRLKRLLTLHGNEGRFLDLVKAVGSESVVPVIGAGMSKASGFPLWRDFLHDIRRFTPITESDLDRVLSAGKYEEAVDQLAAAAGNHLFEERIEQELRVDDPSQIMGPVRFLPALFSKTVLTTNLDDVLEHVYSNGDVKFDEVLVGPDVGRYRKLETAKTHALLKLHGDCRRIDGRVLGVVEYNACYAPGCPTRESLSLLCRTKALLWMGCSLGIDRTVNLIRETIAGDGAGPRHFAFLKLPGDDAIRIAREIELTKLKIFPIWFDDVDDADDSIAAFLVGILDWNDQIANLGGPA